MPANAPNKVIKKRQGIDNVTRLQICQFVASQAVPPSTKIVRDWAEATFGRKFPQSTLSTLLRSNGLQIKQAGGRGRRCRTDVQISTNPDRNLRSTRTNVLISHLKLLADGRCRGRSSEHPEIELSFLEEAYLMLQRSSDPHSGCNISISWFHQLARDLFHRHNEPLPKNISQFLNQIYDKYYLINMVYQHLFLNLPYDKMLEKLAIMYPDLIAKPSPPLPIYQYTVPQTPPPDPEDHSYAVPAPPPCYNFVPAPIPGVFTPPSPALATGIYTPPSPAVATGLFTPPSPKIHTNLSYPYQKVHPPIPHPVHFAVPAQQHEQWDSIAVMEHAQHPAPVIPGNMNPRTNTINDISVSPPAATGIVPPVYPSFGDYQAELDLGYNLMLDNVFSM